MNLLTSLMVSSKALMLTFLVLANLSNLTLRNSDLGLVSIFTIHLSLISFNLGKIMQCSLQYSCKNFMAFLISLNTTPLIWLAVLQSSIYPYRFVNRSLTQWIEGISMQIAIIRYQLDWYYGSWLEMTDIWLLPRRGFALWSGLSEVLWLLSIFYFMRCCDFQQNVITYSSVISMKSQLSSKRRAMNLKKAMIASFSKYLRQLNSTEYTSIPLKGKTRLISYWQLISRNSSIFLQTSVINVLEILLQVFQLLDSIMVTCRRSLLFF